MAQAPLGDGCRERQLCRAADAAVERRDGVESRIAREEFVGAQPAHRHPEPGAVGSATGEPAVDAIDRRLVHRLEDGLEAGFDVAAVEPLDDVLCAVERGRADGEGNFVELGPGIFGEADGNRLDPRLAERRHRAEQRGGIDPGG